MGLIKMKGFFILILFFTLSFDQYTPDPMFFPYTGQIFGPIQSIEIPLLPFGVNILP
jgi:hypothetical protein